MKQLTSLYTTLLLNALIYSIKAPDNASLLVSPSRSQFFKRENVSLSCEVQQWKIATWRVVRNTPSKGTQNTQECSVWGVADDSSCTISHTYPSDTGLYWCQTWSGEQSNAVNITVHDGPVILESPALPVTEGHSVTLSCRYQTTPSNLTADFYKDGYLISTESTGEMTIPAVNKSDEGAYSCRHSELGESPESLLAVRAPSLNSSPSPTSSLPAPPSPSPTTSPEVSISVSRLLCSLLVVSPYLIVTFIVLLVKSPKRAQSENVSPNEYEF
ncbi:hypothetical protein UPYG_G00246850 [Umbra pygmaea]|uniref:Ig-like domain-containing protein n=1 Tax=Umbra pygmaea TaxID=75934 RepID=A0ABD0X2L2_UMBPY